MSDFNIEFEENDQQIKLEFEQAGGGAVKSVNGKTGVVVLDADDVGAYTKPSGGIPKTDLASAVQTSLGKADSAYQKPSSGIPASDMASGAIPTVDNTLTTAGAAADAKKTGDEIATVKDGLSDTDDRVTALEQGGSGSGLTDDIKLALLQIASKVAYIDEDGQDYYDALNDALYPPAELVSISAVYTQSETVYETDSLNSLRSDLVVTAHMSDGTTREVITYALSGTLAEGTSTITASYGGKTTTFSVIVSSFPNISWNLSKGALPSTDDGITTTDTSGKFTTSFSSTNGITLTGTGSTSDTVRYLPTDYNTAKKVVCETVFTITSINGSSAGNFTILLSNGTSGINLQFADKAKNVGKVISYINGSQSDSLVNVGTWELNTEYTVRCEYVKDGTNKIYLDGTLLYESTAVSSFYTTVNRIHAAGKISVNIKSFKWIIQEAI